MAGHQSSSITCPAAVSSFTALAVDDGTGIYRLPSRVIRLRHLACLVLSGTHLCPCRCVDNIAGGCYRLYTRPVDAFEIEQAVACSLLSALSFCSDSDLYPPGLYGSA